MYGGAQEGFRLFCIPAPKNDFSDAGNKIVTMSYCYYMLKIIDLLDTVCDLCNCEVFKLMQNCKFRLDFLHSAQEKQTGVFPAHLSSRRNGFDVLGVLLLILWWKLRNGFG